MMEDAPPLQIQNRNTPVGGYQPVPNENLDNEGVEAAGSERNGNFQPFSGKKYSLRA